MSTPSFGRPKKYKKHRDLGAYGADPNIQHETVAEIRINGSSVVQKHFGMFEEAKEMNREQVERKQGLIPSAAKPFYTKVIASFNDPRVVWYVADSLLNSTKGSYIRPKNLAFYLNQTKPMYHWDENMLGRLLGGIWAACRVAYVESQGDYEDKVDFIPLAQGRDTYGRYYVVDPKGGNEGRLWMLAFRQAFWVLSDAQMQADAAGKFKQYWGKEMQPVDWMSAVYSEPVRGQSGYHAQLEPDSNPAMVPVVSTEDAFSGTDVVVGRPS